MKPSIGRIVLLENNGPVDVICGIITKVHDDDGRGRYLINVRAFEDQNPTPWLLLKVPEKAERGELEPTPSWAWFWPEGLLSAEDVATMLKELLKELAKLKPANPLVEAEVELMLEDDAQQTAQVVQVV